jgi:hypothetical protein
MRVHGYKTLDDVRLEFPNFKTVSDSTRQEHSIRGLRDTNPLKGHGGKYSPFSKRFIHYDESTAKDKITNLKKTAIKNRTERRNDTTTIEYYEKRGMSYNDAVEARSSRQRAFSKKICIEKHGFDKGIEIWRARQERWLNTMFSKTPEEQAIINKKRLQTNGSISKIEQRFVGLLKEHFDHVETQFVISKLDKKHFLKYDVKIGNCIFELNGSYWHANPKIYKENDVIKFPYNHHVIAGDVWKRDAEKLRLARENGYQVCVVWDKELIEDPTGIIKNV